jgi:hypothetical protein
LTQRPEQFDEIATFPPLSTSDHLPVLYRLNTKFTIQETKHKHYNYKLADWKGYQTHLFDTLPPSKFLSTLQDLKDAIETLTTAILQSANRSIPSYVPRPPFLRKMPKHITHLIQIYHKLLNNYRQTRLQHLKSVLRSLTHQISNLRRKWLSSIWQDKLLTVHADNNKI